MKGNTQRDKRSGRQPEPLQRHIADYQRIKRRLELEFEQERQKLCEYYLKLERNLKARAMDYQTPQYDLTEREMEVKGDNTERGAS